MPVTMGREQAAALPNCRARFLAGEGHFSLLINHLDEILATLCLKNLTGDMPRHGAGEASSMEAK